MKQILLPNGMFAVVDDADFDLVADYGWSASGEGCYVTASRGGSGVILARLILGEPIGLQVDHINGNRLDNRRCNLRPATPQQNLKNRPAHPNRTYKGVNRSRKVGTPPFEAAIYCDNERHHIGYFETAEETARAYDAAAIRLHGEFAHLNFPLGYDYLPDRIIETELLVKRGPVKRPQEYTAKELRANRRLFFKKPKDRFKINYQKG